MHYTPELARSMMKDLLGREFPEPALAEAAQRLSALLGRLRAIDEERLIGLEPAGAFAPAHPAWAQPRPEAPAWATVGPAVPGSGGIPAAGEREVAAMEPGRLSETGRLNEMGRLSESGATRFRYSGVAAMADLIRRGEVSPVALMQASLERTLALNPTVNAFISVAPEQALAAAHAAERELTLTRAIGPLHGVPLAVKDLFFTAGMATTGGSQILAGWLPDRDATAVARLSEAGALLVGKTHTHEFAYGATSGNVHYGPARNPWDLTRIPGGSSGGSAIAVCTGMVPVALGSDTAGSVRIPAAACGVVGLKPTYGRVSKAGVLPLSWSQDTVGSLTRSVADAALVLAVLAGSDPLDHTAVPVSVPDYEGALGEAPIRLQGVRVGVPRAWWADRVEPQVRDCCLAALDVLRSLGAELVDVQLPPVDVFMLVNRLLTLSEASSYHAPYLRNRAAEYGPETRARLEMGQLVLAQDYLTAQRLRGELCQHVARVMDQVDVLVTPTLPVCAPRIDCAMLDWQGTPELTAEALVRLTSPFNVTGQPAISVPCGYPAGLPVGLQIVGRPFAEPVLLRVAAAYEAAAGWQDRHPAL